MRNVRRFYIYSVALVSLEMTLWGLIILARSIFCPAGGICGGAGISLARGLALVVVGLPVFLFHWLLAQRSAQREMDERASGLRATFLYGTLLGTLIPVVQNILALVNRPALTTARLQGTLALVGGTQTWSDNLIAILLNLLVAAYFLHILRRDWKVIQPDEPFANLRRLYRWFWSLYGLGLTVTGMNQVLRFIIHADSGLTSFNAQRYWAVNGIVALLVGVPVWVHAWLRIQGSLGEEAERQSFLRLALLYILSLLGAVVTLASAGVILEALLRSLFGVLPSSSTLLEEVRDPLAVCVPFLVIWLYYGRWLGRAMAETDEAPRRAGLRRVYLYILSALGVGVVFASLQLLFTLLVDLALLAAAPGEQAAIRLSGALALLLIGLPLWLLAWRPMQAEARSREDAGDHARRSLTRRIYLYLALFVGVIGGMVTAISLLNALLEAAFTGNAAGLAHTVLKLLGLLLLFIGLGLYHGLALRSDGSLTASLLADRHAAFPVLILDPGDGFGEALAAALHKSAPSLPVSVQAGTQPLPEDTPPLAVVLPSDLALDPPAPIRDWLASYPGRRMVVPRPAGPWLLVGQPARPPLSQAAQALRQLAEGQEPHTGATPAWLVAVYVAAALVGLPILVSLLGSLISAFMQ